MMGYPVIITHKLMVLENRYPTLYFFTSCTKPNINLGN